MHRLFVLSAEPYYRQAMALIDSAWLQQAKDGRPLAVRVTEYKSTRSLDQNARMWSMLHEVARQVDWHGQRLTPEEWKDVFTAALKRQKVVPGLDGGFVVLGTSTRAMSKSEMSDLMELMSAFGAERGVRFADDGVPA